MKDLGNIEKFSLATTEKRVVAHHHVGRLAPFEIQCLLLDLGNTYGVTTVQKAAQSVLTKFPAFSARIHRRAGGELFRTQSEADQIVCHTVPADKIKDTLTRENFELTGGPLAFAVLSIDGPRHYFGLALHPAVADTTTVAMIEAAFMALLQGQQPDVQTLRPLEQPSAQEVRARLEYWRPQLAEDNFVNVSLPQRYGAINDDITGQVDHAVQISPCEPLQLSSLADVKIRIASSLGVVLSRYSGQGAVRFSLSHDESRADRRNDDFLPCLVTVKPTGSFATVLERAAKYQRVAQENSLPSALLLQDMLKTERTDQHPLGSISLYVTNDQKLPPDVSRLIWPRPTANGECQIFARVMENGAISLTASYPRVMFEPAIIERFLVHVARVFESGAKNPAQAADRIPLVRQDELAILSAPYDDDIENDPRPFHQIIADHARTTPDKTALICADQEISHAEMNDRANQLAHLLIANGVSADIPVAIMIERGIDAVISILATAKAGGAFIPVEPDHPESRNHHILTDAGVHTVITRQRYLDRLPSGIGASVLCLDDAQTAKQPDTDPDVVIHPDQLAYIMYTSGSTGKPKGVAVEHSPLTHHNQSTARVYEMSAESRELPFLPFSSDGGHERWMVPLMVGGSAVIPDGLLWTPEQSFAAMRKYGCNNASIPTTYLQQLAEWSAATGEAPAMRLYSFGGEGLAQSTFDLLSRELKAPLLINGYGPTETIMTPMVWKVRAGTQFDGAYAPLGRAVGDRRAYVLDARMMPCPIGVVGEIHLGGTGVARGYVNRPGTTAERFIPDPFGPILDGTEGGRLYRSGDLGRWREDGTIEFLGRVDLQIKLNGYRIEPGEIEAVLMEQSGVSEALVLLREDDGEKQLVAYAVAQDGTDEDVLMRKLEVELPKHMVPSAVVVLDRMPINPNAKLDRAALPMPKARANQAKCVPPKGETERIMLAMWQAEIRRPEIGVTDNFFDMGGKSLIALKVLSRMRTRWPDVALTIADLFDAPTVRALAGRIDTGSATGRHAIALRGTGSQPMLYCFPGLLVSTREYMQLTEHLGVDQPVTGFLCHSLNEAKKMNVSVQDVVAEYVQHIRSESAGRPCAFLGWSWGGLLAWEAAKQLQGEIDLRMIGMVDVCDLGTDFAPAVTPTFARNERDMLMGELREWLEKTQMRSQWDLLIGSMDKLCFDQFLRFIGNEADPLPTDGPEVSSREHTFWVLIDNALVFRRYQLEPLNVRVESFSAGDSLSRGLNLVDWRGLSTQARPSQIVPGSNHLHIIGNRLFHKQFAGTLKDAFKS